MIDEEGGRGMGEGRRGEGMWCCGGQEQVWEEDGSPQCGVPPVRLCGPGGRRLPLAVGRLERRVTDTPRHVCRMADRFRDPRLRALFTFQVGVYVCLCVCVCVCV